MGALKADEHFQSSISSASKEQANLVFDPNRDVITPSKVFCGPSESNVNSLDSAIGKANIQDGLLVKSHFVGPINPNVPLCSATSFGMGDNQVGTSNLLAREGGSYMSNSIDQHINHVPAATLISSTFNGHSDTLGPQANTSSV